MKTNVAATTNRFSPANAASKKQFPASRPRYITMLLWLTLPAVLQAQFTYITNNGAITITGYTGPGGDVVIPSSTNGCPVTSIGDSAFRWCTSLTSVTIPNSVTSIGYRAFYFCTSLSAITVDTSNSFYSSVAGVLFDKSQTTLIQYPAGNYETSYTIPNRVTDIGNFAFSYCTSLTSVTIPNSVTSIGYTAFEKCTSLTSVTIPDSVTDIGGFVFLGCADLTTVTIPNSVTSIGEAAFFDCSSLATVTIPNSVIEIGNQAFSYCTSLTSVTIPGGVTSIGHAAFGWCTSLTAITVDALNPVYSSADGVLFHGSQTTLIQWPGGKAGSYTVPNSVTSIGPGAFRDCAGLTTVTIPDSVADIGDRAFADCIGLTGVYFWGDAPSGVGGNVFSLANKATVYYLPGTTGWGSTFGGRPTALWRLVNPLILSQSSSLGVQTNGFSFIISWATNISVVVEACADLANPTWSPVATNTLTGGWSYFSDPNWTNCPARFYRIRSP
jgi:hypothetical protein